VRRQWDGFPECPENLIDPGGSVALDSNVDGRRRNPQMVAVVKQAFSDDGLVVHARSVAALQVANKEVTVLDGQDAVVATNHRILELQIAIRSAPDQEFGRLNDYGTRSAFGYGQCDFHGSNPPSLGWWQDADGKGHDRIPAGASRLPE